MDSRFMTRAIELARLAAQKGEIPVGAVIVKDKKIIAEGYNMRENKKNALSHAEIEAINAACKALGDWRLDGCTIYVTLEPCPMCAGAIINARIKEIVFGAYDLSMGCMDSVTNMANLSFATGTTVYGGIKEDECKKLLTDFFEGVRK
ncbi:MAG: nucleoside deaminase [Ruminococcaceae bacterium]|nr:nucleoside deaminase [Oscillospiraceae bacterium]